jgi:predicted DNA-binding transcriptional regulator AlpA
MQLLTKKEVADKCKMTVEWVTEAISLGKIPPPINLDGHERWIDLNIDKWIEAGCPLKQKIEDTRTVQQIDDAHNGLETDKGDVNLEQLQKWAIKCALEKTNGNRELAAQLLGIGERTLYRKIKEYELPHTTPGQ